MTYSGSFNPRATVLDVRDTTSIVNRSSIHVFP